LKKVYSLNPSATSTLLSYVVESWIVIKSNSVTSRDCNVCGSY
jgi:hypothetical protein